MHTRRLASFLLGAWLAGSILLSFIVAGQNFAQVDRILETPPGQIGKDINDLGEDVARQMFRYQAAETNRFLFQIWGIIQLGIALAFLTAVTITAHRNKLLMLGGLLMLLITCLETLYLVPSMTALGRQFDFLPPAATSPERDTHQTLHVWSEILEVVKLIAGLVLAGRLLFDRMSWGDRLLPAGAAHTHRRRRRRKRTWDGSVAEEIQAVDHAHDSHVDG
ncbi:MAG TPA: hypothetical protein VFL57_14495 [Bryobacteraceae bacterium]|nr:hypothetical protein [Bryobacteraceae bacterium]